MKTIRYYKNNSDPEVIIVIRVNDNEVYEGKLGECPSKFDELQVLSADECVVSTRKITPDFFLECCEGKSLKQIPHQQSQP